jgi:hypothetical protein
VPNGIRAMMLRSPCMMGTGSFRIRAARRLRSITLLRPLYSDARLAGFARAYQEKTGFHRVHPKLG